jgi:hypothetical protein
MIFNTGEKFEYYVSIGHLCLIENELLLQISKTQFIFLR